MPTVRVPDEFGIIRPQDTGMYYKKQGGGMTPRQYELEGVYIPLGEPTVRLGHPNWKPSGSNFGEKLRAIDVSSIPESDRETMPERVVDRGHFADTDEYFNWVKAHPNYGRVSLYKDLWRFTYGMFDMLDSDPRDRWEDVDELWDTIDESFPFRYEKYDYFDEGRVARQEDRAPNHPIDADEYPQPEAAMQWITITGSKTYKGNAKAPWAEEMKGETVILLCPNAD